MTVALTLPGKLAKLVSLLGGDKDGEILATVDAIGRSFRSADRDWHDVAKAVERGWSASTSEPPPKQQFAWWQRTARSCILAGGYNLKLAESDFLRSMMTWPTEPNQKQRVWLKAIATALDIECAA